MRIAALGLPFALIALPIALASLHFGWGIVGVWAAITALIAVRVTTCGARFAGRRWAVAGVRRTAPEGS